MNKTILLSFIFIFSIFLLLQLPDVSAFKTAITGFFQGTIDEDGLIKTNGQYQINRSKSSYELKGTIQELFSERVDVTCRNIIGHLVLSGEDSQRDLTLTGKKCQYGNSVYIMGAVVSVDDSENNIEGIIKGRLTFMINQETNYVYGFLKGSIES
jgi:hypothetical protein